MIHRKAKKLNKKINDSQRLSYWLTDYRAYLIEADYENADLRIIDRQFKRKLIGSGNQYFRATRMHEYRKLALS